MRKGGSKAKGSSFERQVASCILKAAHHVGIKISKRDCYRTPQSGGHVYAKESHPSDLHISSRLRKHFPFIVECKAYKKVNLWHFILQTPKSANELQWLKQLHRESKRSKHRTPLLVFKGNNLPIFCAHPIEARPFINDWKKAISSSILFRFKDKQWILVPFEDFLAKVFEVKK